MVTAAAKLRATLATPGLRKLVACYFEPDGDFAGMTFTELGDNPPNEITTDDLLAASLLDLSWPPSAVRAVLQNQNVEISAKLACIDAQTELWDASEELLAKVDDLWSALVAIKGIGDVRAVKLLARKRPLLGPITDSVVVGAIGLPKRTRDVIRCLTKSEADRALIQELCPAAASGASLLRILDVAVWMLYSQSRAAKNARKDTGLSPG